MAFNDDLIAHFRKNRGVVTEGPFTGRDILVLTTTGATSGLPRTHPLVYTRDGDQYLVIASKGGAPTNPAWYANLVANPEVTIEQGGETFPARAATAEEPERTRLFDQQTAEMPFYDGCRKKAKSRQIPVIVFDRLT